MRQKNNLLRIIIIVFAIFFIGFLVLRYDMVGFQSIKEKELFTRKNIYRLLLFNQYFIFGMAMALSGAAFQAVIIKEESYYKKSPRCYKVNIGLIFIIIFYISILVRLADVSKFAISIFSVIFSSGFIFCTNKKIYFFYKNKKKIKVLYLTIFINLLINLFNILKNIIEFIYKDHLDYLLNSYSSFYNEEKYLLILLIISVVPIICIIKNYITINKNTGDIEEHLCVLAILAIMVSLGIVASNGVVLFIGLVIPHIVKDAPAKRGIITIMKIAFYGGTANVIFLIIYEMISKYIQIEISALVALMCMPYILFEFSKVLFKEDSMIN